MEPLTVNHLFSFLFAALAGDCVGKFVWDMMSPKTRAGIWTYFYGFSGLLFAVTSFMLWPK